MKKFAIYISLLLIAIIMADTSTIEKIGFSSAKRRIFDNYMRMVAVSNTGDSLLSVPPDSVRLFIATQISDSVNSLDHRTLARLDSFSLAKTAELNDSINAVESRMTVDLSDSTQAAIDSARTVLANSKAYTNAREVAITTAYKAAIRDSLNSIETMVSDSSSAYLDSLRTAKTDLKYYTIKSIHDSLNQAQVNFAGDIKIKGNDLTFGNGASISNASADTARVTETAVKIEGKLVNFNDYVSHPIATNTILGITAGEDLTTGFSNTFTGQKAGKNATTGYVNSFYGADAGESVTTGFHNNFFGYYAGAKITTGKYNNFFGSETGMRLTTGEHNTIMGHDAMLGTLGDAGTASYNTAIGANSCYKVATGTTNATLGFRAMGTGDGSYNTMLGAFTGNSNPGNIGDRNVFIGYMAGSRCLTASDSLIIASEDGEILKGSFADSSLIATGKFTIEGDELAFGSGASITNPSSGILSLNSGIVSIPSDSTYAGQVLHADTTKTNVIIMPNGAVVSNIDADSLRLTEANTIIDGNAKINGLLTLTEGTSTTFTQATNRLTLTGDSLSIRAITNINPYRATSPQTSTFIGMGAGSTGQVAGNTIAIGYSSGKTVGSNSIAIGSNSGGAGTGAENIYIGSDAGASVSTGSRTRNTVLGYQASFRNNGSNNIYIGRQAGYGASSNATGTNNTAIGQNANFLNSTGSWNSFYGVSSGYNNSSGSYGVAIGDSAGYNNTTGNRNVFIGYKAIGTDTSSDQFILQSDNGSKVQRLMQGSFADSSLTINGYMYKKKQPFAKFKRTTTFTPSAADTWLRVPICEVSGAHNTPHFTCAADSSLLIGRAMMLHVTAAVKKYVGVNTSETALFRLVKGAISGGRSYSICGQYEEEVAQAIGENRTIPIPASDMGFAAGDSLWLEFKTTDVGLILKPNTNFTNPASATINLNYLFDL